VVDRLIEAMRELHRRNPEKLREVMRRIDQAERKVEKKSTR
jgi:PHD/YefM family antitoxin component YafN of YafNO toxin-antitoxin module